MNRALIRATTFFLGVVLVALCVAPLMAQPLSAEQRTEVEKIFAEVSRISGYGHECETKYWMGYGDINLCTRVPKVVILELPEGYLGRYNPFIDPNTVQISSAVAAGSAKWRQVVAHEFTHYLQWRAGKLHYAMGCIAFAGIEAEAYDVADEYSKARGEPSHPNKDWIIFELHTRCSAF